VILYDGPSLLTGDPVVAVATGLGADRWAKSRNVKTGSMVQAWILRRDRSPIDAAQDGSDNAICGDCAQRAVPGVRRRSCYVNVAWAPLNIWRKAVAGGYPPLDAVAFSGALVRIGAYGDPAAVPHETWLRVLAWVRGWTGYTHAWSDPRFQDLRGYCMASVDSPEEADRARALGWRTFRVRRSGAPLHPGARREVACPASEEAGHRTTCAACRICDGLARAKAPDVVINAHGPGAGIFGLQQRQQPLFHPPTVLTQG